METTKRCFVLRKQHQLWWKRRNSAKYRATRRLNRVKIVMKAIKKDQQSIKEGQRQVGAKLKAVAEECEQLRNETNQIMRQSANTQIRLALMFSILKAREQGDLDKAAHLTRMLREIIGRDK